MDQPASQAVDGYIADADTLNEALKAGEVGVWRWRIDTDVLEWSANLQAIHGLPPGSFNGSLSSFYNDIHPSDADRVRQAVKTTLRTGQPYRIAYRTKTARGPDPVWIEARGDIVTGADGVRYLAGTCIDVTARRAGEEDRVRGLRRQAAIERFGTFAFGEASFPHVLEEAVKVAADELDVPLTKILQFAGTADHLLLAAGIGWQEGLVGKAAVGIDRQSQAGYTLLAGEPVIVTDLKTETRFSGPNLLHDHGVRSGMSVVIPGSSTRPFGVFGIHDRRVRRFSDGEAQFLLSLATIVANAARHNEAAEHRLLLVREMAHRAGNMLQLVATIANQTFSDGADIERARGAFNERLGSLSRANYLVAHGGWTSTRIKTLFADTLLPFSGRIEMEGRDVLLPPDLCFDLGLAIHELATNSAKYGSLAQETGTVHLTWGVTRIPGDRFATFTVTWRDPRNTERNRATPRLGFGSRMLTALVESKWGGRIEVDRRDGYCFSASIPFTPA